MLTPLPQITPPPGDPTALRAGARNLESAAGRLQEVSRRLAEADSQASQAWQSDAQRVFAVLAGTWRIVTRGAAEIIARLAGAMTRYASVLEQCQAVVQQADRRLQTLVATTPPGMPVDPTAVSAIVAQARQAQAAADQAARELAATAADLLGPVDTNHHAVPSRDASASFVSHTHAASAGVLPTGLREGFDARAATIERQLASAIGGLFGTATRSEPATMTIGGSSFSSSIGTPSHGGTVTIGGSSFSSSIGTTAPGRTVTIGGSTFSSSIGTPSFTGTVTIGGPRSGRTGNPVADALNTLTETRANFSRRGAVRIWGQVFPGVPAPDSDAGAILMQLLKRGGDRLTPAILQQIEVVQGGINYANAVTTLPDGFGLVRRVY